MESTVTTSEAGRPRSAPARARRAVSAPKEDVAALKGKMRGAVARLDLPRHQAQTFEALIDIWQPGGGLYPEQATIALRSTYGSRWTRDALAGLRSRGLLTWQKRRYRGVQTSNLYQFTPAFWAVVHGGAPCATGGSQCRQQAAPNAARSRHPLPTNGDLPLSDRSLLNRGGEETTNAPPLTPPAPNAAAPSPTSPPSPVCSSPKEGDRPTSWLPSLFTLERAHLYGTTDPGTMRAEHLHATEAQIEALAADALAWADARHVEHEDAAAVREQIARDLVRRWLAHPGSMGPNNPRGYLVERAHPFGCLRGDVGRFGAAALDAWKAAHKPKRAPKNTTNAAPDAPTRPQPRRIPGELPAVPFAMPARFAAGGLQGDARASASTNAETAPSLAARPSDEPPPLDSSPSFGATSQLECAETDDARKRRKDAEEAAEVAAHAEICKRAGLAKIVARPPAPPPRPSLSPEQRAAFLRLVEEEEERAARLAWDALDVAPHQDVDAAQASDTAEALEALEAPPNEAAPEHEPHEPHEHEHEHERPDTAPTASKRAHREGRARIATRPAERLAMLATIAALATRDAAPRSAAADAPHDAREHAAELHHHQEHDDVRARPLLLRDARTRPTEHAPRRGRRGPPGRS